MMNQTERMDKLLEEKKKLDLKKKCDMLEDEIKREQRHPLIKWVSKYLFGE